MKRCGECAHHMYGAEGWTCDNEESEYYGLETEYNDSCVDYEERE